MQNKLANSTRRMLPPKHSRAARIGKIARAAGWVAARFFLIAAATVAYGLLLGLANRAALADVSERELEQLEPLAIPLELPPGEELVTFDTVTGDPVVTIPQRPARWGRPLDAAMVARRLSFRCRFADFPEYKPEDAPPSLRIFDFTTARWEQ